MRIFHIATLADWTSAQATGRYTTSTRGRTLAEEGFIHACRGDQWQAVRSRFYADVTEPLVLLTIDTDRLDAPVVDEAVVDAEVPGGVVPGTETFPHVYGAINVDAVVAVLSLGAAHVPAPAVPRTEPEKSFRELFLAELAFRAALGLAVILFAALVGHLAQHVRGDTAGLLGALAAFVVAASAGFWVSRARDRRWREAHPPRS